VNYLGGQQQRTSIGRAMITNPSIILADEPTGNLDTKSSEEIVDLLKKSNRDYKQTIIMITHNIEIAKQADRIIRLEDGKIKGGIKPAILTTTFDEILNNLEDIGNDLLFSTTHTGSPSLLFDNLNIASDN